MEYEIRDRFYGNVIFSLATKSFKLCVEAAVSSRVDLSGSNLSGADLFGSNLFGSDLSEADLSGSNLSVSDLSGCDLFESDLSRADLSGCDLSGVDLSGCDLSGAIGVNKFLSTPLYILLDQVGKIRAYKLVTAQSKGPYKGGIVYEIGKTVSVVNACTDENRQCAVGISLATLDWCIKEWREGYKILIAEFTRKDIAAIPTGTDGKFRVSKCKIIGEKDLKKIGILLPAGHL